MIYHCTVWHTEKVAAYVHLHTSRGLLLQIFTTWPKFSTLLPGLDQAHSLKLERPGF